MAPCESPSICVSRRGSAGSDAAVVWVRGEHDITTRVSLTVAIARAALRQDGVLVDLSGVTFMDATTVGAIVGSANRLRSRGQMLAISATSMPARRVLELCGLAHLVPDAEALLSAVAAPVEAAGALARSTTRSSGSRSEGSSVGPPSRSSRSPARRAS